MLSLALVPCVPSRKVDEAAEQCRCRGAIHRRAAASAAIPEAEKAVCMQVTSKTGIAVDELFVLRGRFSFVFEANQVVIKKVYILYSKSIGCE